MLYGLGEMLMHSATFCLGNQFNMNVKTTGEKTILATIFF
jgi:hypothetical protein